MPNHIKSMPPPLIPLPSPTNQYDSTNPFDSLFSEPGPSQPLFVPKTCTEERAGQAALPPTPSSGTSDFGAFVSVPSSMDPLQKSSENIESLDSFPTSSVTRPSSEFFDQFTVQAKERTGQNERRVLNELLEHEDDPLYWINSERTTSKSDVATLVDVDAPSSGLIPVEQDNAEPLLTPDSSSDPPDPPLIHSSPSTLSRSWVFTLLSNSAPSPARTAAHVAGSLPPQLNTNLPRPLTHSSPFAAHVYVAPTGAPGFAGDYRWNRGGFEFEEQDEKLHSVELLGRRESTTAVLTGEVADQLRSSLPALSRLAKTWSLLYSLDQHGVSLQTLYARCAVRVAGTLIAIRDSEDRVFGAWMSDQMHMSPGAYYGSGESFLWRSIRCGGQEHVEVFKWTGKNDYVALCEASFISFGGGEGKYGLYLDANLMDGSSARCSTYDNAVLCTSAGFDESKTVPFECVGVETWGVAS